MPVPGDSFLKVSLYKPGSKGSVLVSFSESVPHVREVRNDQQEMNRRTRSRLCLQKCLDHMIKFPDAAPDVWNNIQAGLAGDSVEQCIEKQQAQETSPTDALKEAAPAFGKLDKSVLAPILGAMPGGPSSTLLDAMDDKDKHAVADGFGIVFQISMKDKVPQECRTDVTVFVNTMKLCLAGIGFDVAHWFEKSVGVDGTVGWSALPLYGLQYENGRLAKITHVSGDIAWAPAHVTISSSIPLSSASSIDEAHPLVGENPLKAASYFPAGSGPRPHKCRLDKKGNHLQGLCKIAVDDLDAAKEKFSAIADAPELVTLQTRSKRQRDEALEKARADRAAAPKVRRQLTYST
ncbi:unnamed protein product [Prorocentrum cordatum]|uniref:Uncharacterized protein n=1 Tax=Prorocentrum cordatum TaxID=2364126 RepID=A0ABN9QCL7_9DINO|nr:unnamed protein product [Polarella glacialis]